MIPKPIDIRVPTEVPQYEDGCKHFLVAKTRRAGFTSGNCGHGNYYNGSRQHDRQCSSCNYIVIPTEGRVFHKMKFSLVKAIYNVLTLHENGKVSIGDVSTTTDQTYDYGLYVHKGLLTERVKVALKTSTEWSDHVFHPSYRLMPLAEVECFIQENGHLPGVPSADQMVEQGLDMVKTDAMLLEKIEELTLHTIDLNTRLEHAERMIATLMEQLTRTTE